MCGSKVDNRAVVLSRVGVYAPLRMKSDDADCPASWQAACPGEPCTPLTTPYPDREVMAWHAGVFGGCGATCSEHAWTHFNYSVVTTVVEFTGANLTQIGCTMHKRGVRVVLGGFGGLNTSRMGANWAEYRREYIKNGLQTAALYPWIDGFQLGQLVSTTLRYLYVVLPLKYYLCPVALRTACT